MKHTTLKMLALAMGVTSLCAAGETAPVAAPAADSFSFCKWLPSKFKWFDAEKDNAVNPYIQKFDVTFRAQYQWGSVAPSGDGNQINERRSNNEFRRLRMGAKATVFEDYKVKAVFDIGGANGTIKDGERTRTSAALNSFEVSRKIGDYGIEIGKIKPAYTGEYRTSSSKIKTIERSAIVNQLTADKTWGLSVESKDKKSMINWQTGVWLQGLHEDHIWTEPGFSSDTSAMWGASLTIKTGDSSKLYVDYMHSFAKTEDSEPIEPDCISYCGPGAKDVLGLSYEYKKDKVYFMGELIGGFNVTSDKKGAENVFGLVLLPTYKFNDHFEGVFRYQLSAGSNAAKIYKRYYTTNTDASSYSDLMQAFYLGVNYYICPDKPDMMKIMTGIEYVDSHGVAKEGGDKGYTGWQFSTALRVNF